MYLCLQQFMNSKHSGFYEDRYGIVFIAFEQKVQHTIDIAQSWAFAGLKEKTISNN